ncbi:MAG: hypothetical protein CMN73_10380 [Sphingomonas sp.]|nr:hypothetical protein [Sphingomonas sp.]|tara:strand:- start:2292 stop:3848 length:1557 start_codon:yes stop_codon:yes gene_type:complete
MLEQGKIEFGEIDAKHEVFTQNRMGQDIFFRSYLIPPGVNEFQLMQGGRFFIVGQKGSGKTALMLYLRERYRRNGHKNDIVLFKSDLTEDQRQRLISGTDMSVIEAIESAQKGVDYKTNWLWYILVHISYLLDSHDVMSGQDYLEDFKILTGADRRPKQSIFSGLRLSKLKGDITSGLAAGPFKTSVKAEVEAILEDKDKPEIDVIEAAERCLAQIKLKPSKRVALFFDELELFTTQEDQRSRDIYLIRDLLYAVGRINRKIGVDSASIVVYASVRSEVLDEVNLFGDEVNKDIDDFGVKLNWDVRSDSQNQPIIQLIADKIIASEVEDGQDASEDVWKTYFPAHLFGKDIRQYLLDISMFRPRNLVRRLNSAKMHKDHEGFILEDFEESQLDFSIGVWKEIEDELRAVYEPAVARAVKSFLSGFQSRFYLNELETRIMKSTHVASGIRNQFAPKEAIVRLLEILYRSGAIGNTFLVEARGKREARDRWSFRGYSEPLFDKQFVIHESLRKALQLPFN